MEAWDDDALFRMEDEEEEGEFVMGNFADSLGDDFLGLRELGIAAEFGLSSLTIPKRLLKGKNKNAAQAGPAEYVFIFFRSSSIRYVPALLIFSFHVFFTLSQRQTLRTTSAIPPASTIHPSEFEESRGSDRSAQTILPTTLRNPRGKCTSRPSPAPSTHGLRSSADTDSTRNGTRRSHTPLHTINATSAPTSSNHRTPTPHPPRRSPHTSTQ